MNKPNIRPTFATLSVCLFALGPIASLRQEPQKLEPFIQNVPGSTAQFEMLPVPAGEVTIEGKAVKVAAFFMAKFETPWEAFDAFTASGPPSRPYDETEYAPDAVARPSKSYNLPDRGWGHAGFPVISVTFTTAEMFCRWLSAESKKKFRLPTEAEWELACRAGAGADWKLEPGEADRASWHAANSGQKTHPVGKKSPNKLGLHDMLGNVGEWALDAEGEPVLCGPAYLDAAKAVGPTTRRRYEPKWQQSDPQIPKSRWWLADAPFAGFRIVCEP